MKPQLIDLTVFVLSTGEDTTAECENALSDQDCSFAIKYIKNTFPMSRAFQRMPDECNTKYFIQVDGDMVLKPHAIQTLYTSLSNSYFMIYMAYGQLFEEGFGVGGSVRIWKKALFNFFKFRDCRTVDRDLYQRVRRFGLRGKNLNQVLGLHVARHSLFSNYLKTKSDIEKWRFLERPPEKFALGVLENNLQNLPSATNNLLGALMGALTGKTRLVRSKDIQIETERYKDMISGLNLNGNDMGSIGLGNDESNIKSLFCNAYNDSSDTNTQAKAALASVVISIFGKDSELSPDNLLEIAIR